MKRGPWRPALCGLAIATLLFFPLLNAVSVEHGYWLHWRTQDTAETLIAWIAMAALVAATLVWPLARGRVRLAEAVQVIWLAVGAFFAAGGVVKMGAVADYAQRHRAAGAWVGALVALAFVFVLVAVLRRPRTANRMRFQGLTLALSPLLLVFLLNIFQAQVWHLEPRGGAADAWPQAQKDVSAPRPTRTVVLLFDELSADYLYGSAAIDLKPFPALREFVGTAQVYAGAYLPGGQTGAAIPSLFGVFEQVPVPTTGRPPEPARRTHGGLVARLHEHGKNVRVFGWYLDYCTSLAADADACRAVSIYNARTLGSGFSPLHPLWTNLNLLPADPPFGLLKVVPAVRLHRLTAQASADWLRDQLALDEPDVLFVHVNLPHSPFIADDFAEGGPARFWVTRERYLRQLHFVDEYLAGVVAQVAATDKAGRVTRIVVMSDHNVRALTPKGEHEHVAFLSRLGHGEPGLPSNPRRSHAADLLIEIIDLDSDMDAKRLASDSEPRAGEHRQPNVLPRVMLGRRGAYQSGP